MTDLGIPSLPHRTPQAVSPHAAVTTGGHPLSVPEADSAAAAAHSGNEREIRRLALDITRACQAACDHCYNASGPSGTSGEMTHQDWLSVLDQAAVMGVQKIQLIGGEPTLHPGLSELVNRALDLGMQIEVYSNLIHVRASLWPVLRQRDVVLATSYYSDRADEHEEVTHHRGSYARTKGNIKKAVGYGIPLRAGIVHVLENQRIEAAAAELRGLGVTRIHIDRVRKFGRAAGDSNCDDASELCGNCTRGRAAILPSGDVAGCVMSAGMMTAGSVRNQPLASIIGNTAWQNIEALIPPHRSSSREGCVPDEDSCMPSPGHDPDSLWAGGCVPDEDSCAPSPGIDRVGTEAHATAAHALRIGG
jgi:pyruvate-formate lyase-activating enzyme